MKLGPELIKNQGFETVPGTGSNTFANWTDYLVQGGTVSDETTIVHSGGHAAKLVYSGGTPMLYQVFTVTPVTQYELSFWTRGDGTVSGIFSVEYSGGNILTFQTAGVSGTTYQNKIFRFMAPADCTSFTVYFYAGTNGTAYFDDVSLRQIFQDERKKRGFGSWKRRVLFS